MSDIAKKMFSEMAKHAAALFYAQPLEVIQKGSAESIQQQGTITFVKYKSQCFGITNGHVLENYDGPSVNRVYHIALSRHEPLPGKLLFKSDQKRPDFPYDVAVFLLDEPTIVGGGKIPIELESYEKINKDDMGLAVGFPGHERKKQPAMQMAHLLYHIAAACVSASDQKIILHEPLAAPEDRKVCFGGISGGPIFRIASRDKYAFSGISFQGRGFHDMKQVGDKPHPDIWVWGFPFGPEQMDSALELFKPDLNLRLKIKTSVRIL